MRSDNAANISNNLLPFISPFIFRQDGIKLRCMVHSETQDGNRPADVNFATGTRFADQYTKKNQALDFLTPADSVQALNYGDRMYGSIAEVFDVNYQNDMYRVWEDGPRKRVCNGRLSSLRCVNKIQYRYE